MSKFAQGIYRPQNPDKYLGKTTPRYRSSWEYQFMCLCDRHPAIKQWASESVRIPYLNPLTNKKTHYIPDFLVVYEDRQGNNHTELIEIKPSKQTTLESARSNKDKLAAILNQAKWAAAQQWADSKGIRFRIVTERDIFNQGKSKS
jgi:hypothetical protein